MHTLKYRACLLGLILLWLSPFTHAAQGTLLRLPTREGVTMPVYWLAQDGARATLVLFSGGSGGIGKLNETGWPGSNNFLIRSAPLFAEQGFNLAMVGKPSDQPELDPGFRTSARHLQDIHSLLLHLRQLSGAPIWLVGTSMGTISAAAVSIAERDSGLVSGLVLTASVTNFKEPNAVPRQALDRIVTPVLVVHHAQDECSLCRPYETPMIMQKLSGATVKKRLLLEGTGAVSGNPCEALHYHGFAGIEADAVKQISDWIKQPGN